MKQGIFTKSPNFQEFEDDQEEGILSRTGTFISSLFHKVINTINPFKSEQYVQNPYDLNSTNDPINHLNYVDTINNNNNLFISSSFPNSNLNNNNNKQKQSINKNNQIYLGDNNYIEYPELENEQDIDINNDFFTVDDLIKASPNLNKEIFKDIKRPNYIPNEELFQKSKKYVYDNLVKKYKIMKPKISNKIFGESILLLAIQLTNKYNIEKHYDSLVNNNRNVVYRLDIDVPVIIKNYYTNKAKTLFYEDLNENSDNIFDKVNKELINKFSNGLIFNEKDNNNDNNNLAISNEKRFICRTPKTKRNYITSLIENKFNYDYLCPNEKIQCKIYKECLLHKENELRNYARVIEATNNMFKFICQENEKLRETIRQKEEKIEEYTKELILNKIEINEIHQKLNNYEKEVNINNNNNINFETLQKNNNINKKINIYPPSSSKNILDNFNKKDDAFTLKKATESNTQFTFSSKNNNNLISGENTAKFNIGNSISFLSNSNKNNNDQNLFLVLKSQSQGKNDSLIKNDEKDSEIKNEPKFHFNLSDDKKEEIKENENKNDSDKNEIKEKKEENILNEEKDKKVEKNEESNFNDIFNLNKSKKKINFLFNNQKDEKEEEKNNIINNNISNNIFGIKKEENKNDDLNKKPLFGFLNNEKKEEDKKEENKNELNNKPLFGFLNKAKKDEDKKEEEKKEEVKKEENNKVSEKEPEKNNKEENNVINLGAPGINEVKNKEKTEEIILKKESLNNPNNPFISAVNIKTNVEFTVPVLNEGKEKNKNDSNEGYSTRNTMDNTNPFIKINDNSNIENSTSLNTTNNIFTRNNTNSQTNPFVSIQKSSICESPNLFLFQNKTQNQNDSSIDNNTSNNIFSNIINNSENKANSISTFNQNNYNNNANNNNISNNNNFTSNNPFIMTNKNYTQDNNTNTSNNPFINMNTNNNNNNGNNNLSKSQNPFISTFNSKITNSSSNNNKSNNNPFISTLTNAIINTTSNNNVSKNNPFITNNNTPMNSNLNSNNPFITNNNMNSSNSQMINQNNTFSNNNSSTNNSSSLFNFKINTQEGSNRVNPFLDNNNNGFNFMSSNNSFAMGINLKKPGGNSYSSMFDDNKSRKINGFFN